MAVLGRASHSAGMLPRDQAIKSPTKEVDLAKSSGQPKSFLFIHHNSPAQFGRLAAHLSSTGNNVTFASQIQSKPLEDQINTLRLPTRDNKKKTSRSEFEWALFEKFRRRREKGLNPDWIILHTGWGLGLSLRGLFPKARIIGYAEWWFSMGMRDFLYDPDNRDIKYTEPRQLRMLERNRKFAYEMLMADQVVCPTVWQKRQLPPALARNCMVIHEGIDTCYFSPEQRMSASEMPLELIGLPKTPTPLITYATRGMDPYRGFPEACRALAKLLRRDKRIHVAIAGEDRVVYAPWQGGRQYGEESKQLFQAEGVGERVHYLGHLPLPAYRQLLLRSDLHLYFTRPFVLSWSLLEAMACGCSIVASDTEPVREVMKDGVHGLLVDHTSENLDKYIEHALFQKEAATRREAARQEVCLRYDQRSSLSAYTRLFTSE